MQAFVLNLLFSIGRWLLGWLFKLIRPVLRALFNFLWPTLRLLLIVAGLVAAVLILRQILIQRGELSRARNA